MLVCGLTNNRHPTSACVHPAGTVKVLQILTSDDIKGTSLQGEPLLAAFLFHQGDKGISPAAEVHNGVAVMQIETQQLRYSLKQMLLGEVPPIAAVPAERTGMFVLMYCPGIVQFLIV